MDEVIDALIDQQPQESATNSNVGVFADDGDEESGKSSDKEKLLLLTQIPRMRLEFDMIVSGCFGQQISSHRRPSIAGVTWSMTLQTIEVEIPWHECII